MHKVTVNGKIFLAEDGALLSDVLMKSGGGVSHICGGKGKCKKCLVAVDGNAVLSCQYRIHSDISVSFCSEDEIISETGAVETAEKAENLCLALDIGTTTLALALVSHDTKSIVKTVTRANPQRVSGADVMSRIEYCRKNGVYGLQKPLIDTINYMIVELSADKTLEIYVSGNVTMLHIFLGIDCSSIGVAPYTPVFLEGRTVSGNSLGLNVSEVTTLPSIHSFTGADIVAGMSFVGFPKKGRYNLLVDLGTNAEIVLFNEDSALCTSAAAGPCFEGANISCGMSATGGAVYSYKNGICHTVGNLPARGICGTGLVDIVAGLLKNGTVDETGFMECESFPITDGVEITQADIREYQLAKSAVYSAIVTLVRQKGIAFDDIETMYISGGFSAKISVENAVATGLLPTELKDKCVAVNNSSLLGTVKYACEKSDLSQFIRNATYLDLSASTDFSELFIENMVF
ncbi:MAG: DUF4445 domain-containing protein [Clostridia bacterium]|nr:DUF4445 domain-containing protein [Clostridia bacterium]